MPARKTSSGRDTRLAKDLREAGLRISVKELRALMRGVVAAPVNRSRDAWMTLIAPAPTLAENPTLVAELRSLREEIAGDEAPKQPNQSDRRLAALRDILRRRRVDGFVVPRGDAHQGEFVAARSERLAWLTGFSGSAGTAVVLPDRAAIFVDGRYTLQAQGEVDSSLYSIHHLVDEPPSEWISDHLPAGARLGYDPWLHTSSQVSRLRAACEKAGGRLTPLSSNPVDAIWMARPSAPIAPVVPHGDKFAGENSAQKRREIADDLGSEKVDAVFLSSPDSIAWLLNIRGGDIPYTPVPLAFAILYADATVDLFIDERKITDETRTHLGNGVRIAEPVTLAAALDRLGSEKRCIRVDSEAAPHWASRRLRRSGARIAHGSDPCIRPKACKNDVELAGIRAAHRRDGVALARFLAWLAAVAEDGSVSEMSAAARLDALRGEDERYAGPSFETISAAGPNGAIVHYRTSPDTNSRLDAGDLFLIDSGAQYLDGTTDVTRTVAIGTPSREMQRRFTLVLKGHIALAVAVFPEGTSGSQLDAFARRALWAAGLDYDHGTGHGIGCYLGVHEGPQRISKLPSRVALEPGMVLSNEPGYYKEGAYGIRIENLLAVRAVDAPPGAEKSLLGFETLTLSPIDLPLVDPALLTGEEMAWLNTYHARVRAEIGPLLDPETRGWLERATRPVRD